MSTAPIINQRAGEYTGYISIDEYEQVSRDLHPSASPIDTPSASQSATPWDHSSNHSSTKAPQASSSITKLVPNFEPTTLTGTVEFISEPTAKGWVRGKLNAGREELSKIGVSGHVINFTGVLGKSIKYGQRVILYGHRSDHAKYGIQFDAEAAEPDTKSANGLALHIADNCKMIGPVKAKKLIEIYKTKELLCNSCKKEPQTVAAAIGVPVESINAVAALLSEDDIICNTKVWLKDLGFTKNQVTKSLDEYGAKTRSVLMNNPYQMIGEIDGYGFHRADVLALKMGVAKNDPKRIRAGIMYILQKSLDDGDTWIASGGKGGLIDKSIKELNLDTLDAVKIVSDSISHAIQNDGIISKEISRGNFAMALPYIYDMEIFLAETLSYYGNSINPHSKSLSLSGERSLTLNADQQKAASNALTYGISVITGGAGSGKTFLLQTIADAYKAAGKNIACCAPTGKAANRIYQSTGYDASTIHKLLGCDGFSWEYNQYNKLPHDVVIVDEFSMVDVMLAYHLFQSIAFERTTLVIVGDHNQLPPVGPGFPLRDIIQNRLAPMVILSHIVRQSGILKQNCNNILNGIVSPTAIKGDTEKVAPWYVFKNNPMLAGAPSFTDVEILKNFLFEILENHISEMFGYDILKDVQVLAPQNEGKLGIKCLNKRIQRIIQKKLFGRIISGNAESDADDKKNYEYFVGDKIIQLKNDARLGINNGDIGYVREIDGRDGSIEVLFESGSIVTLTKSQQKETALAYACTVHKYQGSQIPCAIFLCHRTNYILLNRSLIYTAATRAQRTCIILGDAKGIKYAMEKLSVEERRTWLSLPATSKSETPTVLMNGEPINGVLCGIDFAANDNDSSITDENDFESLAASIPSDCIDGECTATPCGES